MATNVVVIGPPGAGKSTRIAQAKEVLPNAASISMVNLLRKKGYNLSSGKLIPDEIVMQILLEEIESLDNELIILDGIPRNVQQAEIMKKYGINVDVVVSLPLSEEIAVKRAEDRLVCSNTACNKTYTVSSFKRPKKKGICDKCGAVLEKRSRDSAENAKILFQIYRENTEPLLKYYVTDGVSVRTVFPDDEKAIFIHSIVDM